jgi:hypothetical protein
MTPAIVKTADSDTAQKAMTFEASADRAKVYFVNGIIVENWFKMKHQYPSDLLVDGALIGSKNKDDVLFFELKPGRYGFSWNVRSTDPIDKKTVPQVSSLHVGAGEVLVLQGDYSMGGAAVLGLIGSLLSPPTTTIKTADTAEVKGKTVVLPQSCPETLCLK